MMQMWHYNIKHFDTQHAYIVSHYADCHLC
jgi:hypothetical protein